MTDLIIPNPRFEMPELFYPGRKPVGNVKIDWDKAASQGLEALFLFQDSNVTNVITGEVFSDVGTDFVVKNGVYAIDYRDSSPSSGVPLSTKINTKEDISIIARVFWHPPPVQPYAVIFDDSNSDSSGARFRVNSGSLQFRRDATTDLLAYGVDNAITSEEWNTVGACSSSTNLALTGTSLYVDEEEQEWRGTAANGSGSLVTNDANIKCLGNRYPLMDRGLDGLMEYLMVFSRKLTKQEYLSIHRNPYQFLIPAG